MSINLPRSTTDSIVSSPAEIALSNTRGRIFFALPLSFALSCGNNVLTASTDGYFPGSTTETGSSGTTMTPEPTTGSLATTTWYNTESGSVSTNTDTTNQADTSSSGTHTTEYVTCGNDIVETGEECDGNNLSGATCKDRGFDGGELLCSSECSFDETNCKNNVCGDGVLDPGEGCDDGNVKNDDGCNLKCEIEPKLIFVRSQLNNGDLGGLQGADFKCQTTANTAGLSGSFKAWLSDDNNPASGRLTHSSGPYQNIMGELIAYNWNDLTDGTLVNAIKYDENGVAIKEQNFSDNAWTGTTFEGKSDDDNCSNWNFGEANWNLVGSVGTPVSDKQFWTDWGDGIQLCNEKLHLYCIEQ